MDERRLSPRPPRGRVPIVCAGQSNRGIQFCATYGDYQYIIGQDDFAATAADTKRPRDYATRTGRDVGAYALYFVITGATDAIAERKWASYREGADLEAIGFMIGQANALMAGQINPDTADTAAAIVTQLERTFALNIHCVVYRSLN